MNTNGVVYAVMILALIGWFLPVPANAHWMGGEEFSLVQHMVHKVVCDTPAMREVVLQGARDYLEAAGVTATDEGLAIATEARCQRNEDNLRDHLNDPH